LSDADFDGRFGDKLDINLVGSGLCVFISRADIHGFSFTFVYSSEVGRLDKVVSLENEELGIDDSEDSEIKNGK